MARCTSRRGLLVVTGLLAMVLLTGVEASATDGPETAADTPAILAALDAREVTVLDDSAAMAVRGSAYRYVLVRLFGLNTFDFGPGLDWTWNPLDYRYGAWGGPGWTNGGLVGPPVDPADRMDALFRGHDLGLLTDDELVIALALLPNGFSSFWGPIYVGADIKAGAGVPVDKVVWVSGTSLFAGKLYFGWRSMDATEYFRRQALTGMQLVTLFR